MLLCTDIKCPSIHSMVTLRSFHSLQWCPHLEWSNNQKSCCTHSYFMTNLTSLNLSSFLTAIRVYSDDLLNLVVMCEYGECVVRLPVASIDPDAIVYHTTAPGSCTPRSSPSLYDFKMEKQCEGNRAPDVRAMPNLCGSGLEEGRRRLHMKTYRSSLQEPAMNLIT
jgi:hypothetical protein